MTKDGTTNFVHGFPHVCVSIGLIYNKVPVLGVIYNPFLDQLYTGVKGQGAYVKRHRDTAPVKLPLSKPRPLESFSKGLLGMFEIVSFGPVSNAYRDISVTHRN